MMHTGEARRASPVFYSLLRPGRGMMRARWLKRKKALRFSLKRTSRQKGCEHRKENSGLSSGSGLRFAPPR